MGRVAGGDSDDSGYHGVAMRASFPLNANALNAPDEFQASGAMTYIGGFSGAVIGLFLRYALRGRIADDRIFLIQEALFLVGVGIGLCLDVRSAWLKRKR